MNSAPSEHDVLASLPPPPSALPDYHAAHCPDETLDDCTLPTSISDDVVTAHARSRRSKLPTSAAKASSAAARSMAAVARSTLAHSGRRLLSPRHNNKSPTRTATKAETTAVELSEAAHATDSLASVAAAAGSLTSGLTSSLTSASSSFGSLLFASRSFSSSHADDVDDKSSSSGADREEDEAAVARAAEAVAEALTRQRMKILEDLVQHRRSDWTYLKAMHEGANYWLNVALLREQQVMARIGEKPSVRRGAQFFYLGIGLGTLLGDVAHPELLAMDCCQLLEELEFHFSSSTVQGVKMMVATLSTLHEPLDKESSPECSGGEPFRPSVHKWNQRPVYRRLLTPSIPFPLDYREVLLSLCDILALIYSKLVEDVRASENVNVFESIIRFDDRIKKLFIDPVKREFSAVASQVMAEEMRVVRKTYASGARESESALPALASVTAFDPNATPRLSRLSGESAKSSTD
ncbi:unnamed protein product [Hyaloperonospora brassicae]|uniref:ELMO domain-containing protein n=1 Tax=Hyaloperonospora brassicae TaxID=162125 RepID=A0AAV0TMZ7_HYABA|nr:unnamed protein product [Hyaloperonospora brassicae]